MNLIHLLYVLCLKKKDFSTILFSVIARDNNFCALPS